MIVLRVLLLLGVAACAGCTTPGQTYAKQHPELPAVHQQILTSGKIPNGTAVAGMTHEQVKAAMNGAPSVFDKINGEEAWVYVKRNADIPPPDAGQNSSLAGGRPADLRSVTNDPLADATIKTTVFFQGDRATRAEVSEEKR